MNSTEFSADRRDIRFVQQEFLQVQQLTELQHFQDFSPEDFQLIVSEGIKFAEEVYAPINKIGDETSIRMSGGTVVTPPGFKEAWVKHAESGWLGITSNPDWGGQGLPVSVAIGVLETFYGANPSIYTTSMLTSGAANLIVSFGDDAQKRTYCEKMITGQWGGTMCLSEPDFGSAVGDIAAKAVKAPGGDHYLIKGTKQWISGGDHDFTENNIHLVLARIEGAPSGPKGISLFIVPKFLPDENGNPGAGNDVTTVRVEHKLGIKASPTCVLEFGAGGEGSQGLLLQGENLGMSQMFQLMNHARLVVAYQGLGSASGAYRNALAYANERVQGIPIESGKDRSVQRVPISHHPDVRNMLMTMKATVEGIRGLIYAVAFYTDMAKHGPDETRGYYSDLVDILTPVAKNAGADQGFEAIRLGIQILGGVGYTEEFPLAQALRDTKIASIYEGTSGIQALDLVTRKLQLRGGELFQTLLSELDNLKPEQARSDSVKQAIMEWREAVERLQGSVASVKILAEELGPREGALNATDLCTFFGDVSCNYYLLRMALIAEQRLEEMGHLNGDAKQAAQEDEEVRFYFNKIKTAEHYTYQILPRGRAVAAKIQSRNFAALEAVL